MSSRKSLSGMGVKEVRRQGKLRRIHRQLVFRFRDCRGALRPPPPRPESVLSAEVCCVMTSPCPP